MDNTSPRTKNKSQKDIVTYTTHECHRNWSQQMCSKMMMTFAEQLPTVELLAVNQTT